MLFNVRFGLATNSSSSHSLIIWEGDELPYDDYKDFGWNYFTISSKKGKRSYLASMVASNLTYGLPQEVIIKLIKKWFDVELEVDEYGYLPEVDHQSSYRFPKTFGTNEIDETFLKDLRDFYDQEKLIVLGGNDNDDQSHFLSDRGKSANIHLYSNYVCRKDPSGYWSLFNEKDGTKIRFSFHNMPIPNKAYAPELVDLKITDYCPYGCSFCYQGSTVKGQHAYLSYIKQIIDTLAEQKVFEIAIGGGEPTLHPNFIDILQYARSKGIVPNFTTMNHAWLEQDELRGKILEHCGAFAISVENHMQVKKIEEFKNKYHLYDKVNIHVVMGTFDQIEFEHIMEEGKYLNITLLGFKNTHRGSTYLKIDYDWWLEVVLKHRKMISIDTALADQYQEQLLSEDIPHYLFTTKDGDFSCYIDAVEKTISPSSYCPDEQVQSLDLNNFLPTFQSF